MAVTGNDITKQVETAATGNANSSRPSSDQNSSESASGSSESSSPLDTLERAVQTAGEKRSANLKKHLENWLRNIEKQRLRLNAQKVIRQMRDQIREKIVEDSMHARRVEIQDGQSHLETDSPNQKTVSENSGEDFAAKAHKLLSDPTSAVSKYHSIACIAPAMDTMERDAMMAFSNLIAPHCDEFVFIVANRTAPAAFLSRASPASGEPDSPGAWHAMRAVPVLDVPIIEDEWGAKDREPNMMQKITAVYLSGFEYFAKHFWGDSWFTRDSEDAGGVFEEGMEIADDGGDGTS